jgi:uncharacterized protein (DUF1330 family)
MSEGPVHFIAHFTVTDADTYRVYEKGFFPILKRYGAQFLTYDDAPTVLEGEWAEGRTVLIRFDSEDELKRWWSSEEYQELATHRHAGTESFSVLYLRPPSRG